MAEYDDEPVEQTPLEKAEQSAAQLYALQNQLATEIQRGIRDGTVDDAILDRWEDLGKAGAGVYYNAGAYSGAKSMLDMLGNAGVSKSKIKDFKQRLEGISQGIQDDNLGADLVSLIRQAEGGTPAGTTSGTTARPVGQAAVRALKQRNRASASSDREKQLDPDTPIEVLREIKARQEAAEGW